MPAQPNYRTSRTSAEPTGRGGLVGVQPDPVAHEPQVAEGIEALALYDELTRLPNRRLLEDRLRNALEYARINAWTTGVMFVALDRFGHVNTTHGRAQGDRLLQLVADRLARAVRRGDTVGRLGGDEFAVVLTNLAEGIDAEIVAKKIAVSLATPFVLAGVELAITASIGISLSPYDALDIDGLMQAADAAMQESKRRGRNRYRFFAVPGMPPS